MQVLWLVTLHPFEVGNGRLARAITDMALSQDERHPMRLFSLSAQILREREGYYGVLERTQRDGLDVTDWLQWFLQQVDAAAKAAEQTVANTLAKARFWLRHQTTVLNDQDEPCHGLPRACGSGREGLSAPHRQRGTQQQLRGLVVMRSVCAEATSSPSPTRR